MSLPRCWTWCVRTGDSLPARVAAGIVSRAIHVQDDASVCRGLVEATAAGAALGVLTPLVAVVAVAVRLSSPGPVLHRAIRVGRHGRTFTLLKFRTMVRDAARTGPGITTAGDPRVTPVGRLLRRTKLDELPQLVNIVQGQMRFVGPRPEDPRYVMGYSRQQLQVLDVSPGITSAASVRFRHEEALLESDDWERRYRDEVLPAKLALELEYLKRRSVAQDVLIVVRTVRALFR